MLLLALYGCATPAPQPGSTGALLNFADLAAEITVHHEVTESEIPESIAALQQDAAQNSTD